MNALGVCATLSLTVVLFLNSAAQAQTGCGLEHTEPGAFICYPDPSENAADRSIPEIFHLSAQGNAPEGRTIRRYVVELDGRPVSDNRLATPVQHLSIETNLKSPFSSGSHTLRVVMDGAGSTEIARVAFHRSANLGFCEPFRRFEAHTCLTSNSRGPLEWSIVGRTEQTDQASDAFNGYADLVELYGQNLKSLEADTADAVAVDAQGNLYVATHRRADIELRKYTPDGSLVYDNLLRACGGESVAVMAMALDNQGRVWIAGDTTACLATTPNAFTARVVEGAEPHGFVILIDTKKPSSAPPIYATYLSLVANRIGALRVDRAGNAYIAGTTGSMNFPHEFVMSIGGNLGDRRIGFVSVLNISGSALQWSTLLPGAQLNGLALDGAGNVYVAGRMASQARGMADDVLVATLSEGGQRLSYAAQFGGSGIEEGRAISVNAAADWVMVAGETESTNFLGNPANNMRNGKGPQPFVMALQPCAAGAVYAQPLPSGTLGDSPEIAISPALDAFAGNFVGLGAKLLDSRNRLSGAVQAAPSCPSSKP